MQKLKKAITELLASVLVVSLSGCVSVAQPVGISRMAQIRPLGSTQTAWDHLVDSWPLQYQPGNDSSGGDNGGGESGFQAVPVQARTENASPYFTGNGGRGMSLGIKVPESQGLSADQAYLPTMVQGVLVTNISKYSGIHVLDRISLDRVLAESLDLVYEEKLDGVRPGHVPQVGNWLTGKITKTSTGYTLHLSVNDNTTNGRLIASYSANCTVAQLDEHTAIQAAARELLTQMGVQLTAAAVAELNRAGSQQSISAEAALARGITAQRQGTEVMALSYFFQAAAMDPSLLEAANRSSVISANISSGNIGDDVRNEILWRRNWVQRLTETEQSFAEFNKTQSMPYTLFYSDEIKRGDINFRDETVVLSIEAYLRPSRAWGRTVGVPMQRTLRAVYDGLQATQRASVWELGGWPRRGVTNLDSFAGRSSSFTIEAELLNERNRVIGRQSFRADGSWGYTYDGYAPSGVRISDDVRRTVSFTVKADDISDRLTIRIADVNGTPAETAARNGVLQIRALPKADYDFNVRYNSNDNSIFDFASGEIRGYKGNEKDVVIPGAIWGEPVVSIGNEAFQNKQLTGVTISNSVTSIGARAFANNQLTGVTIPNSVTGIDNQAFGSNQLTSVTIGNGVTTIRYRAFAGNQLMSVTIPSSVTSIGNEAFAGNQLTSVTIPSSVTAIGASAFANNQLRSITIPNSVTAIGASAFANNQLTSVTIPTSVTSIDEGAFSNNQLTGVSIPSSVTAIGASAFSGNQLTSVTIPNSVTSIGSYAFARNQLTGISIGANVLLTTGSAGSFGNNGFEAAYNSGGKLAGTYGRSGTGSTVWGRISGGFLYSGTTAITITGYTGSGGAVTIPVAINGVAVTAIGDDAFANNQLTSVTIPNSVTSIGNNAFFANQLTSVTIPDSVTSIGNETFRNNQLTSISIGANVILGDYSFPNNFVTNYRINKSRAGVYTYNPTTDSNGRSIEYWTCGLRPEASESERKEFESAQAGARANREAVAKAEAAAVDAERKAAAARQRERNRAAWESSDKLWIWVLVILGGAGIVSIIYYTVTQKNSEITP